MENTEVTITPIPHGPYIVKGPITLLNTDGSEIRVEKKVVALCRCGGSSNKPFCDGTHTTRNW